MQISKEEAKQLADDIYEELLKIPSRIMKHKCGNPISKDTAVANIYMTLTKNEHQTVEKENDLIAKSCTREINHTSPCNGFPRDDCPRLKV